jgi:hypothetical protein
MNEDGLMKVMNVGGVRNCVERLGFGPQGTPIFDIRLGRFVPDAFYDKAKRVLSKPEFDLGWMDRLYLWRNRKELPSREDAREIVDGTYDINKIIPLNTPFLVGMGPHKVGSVKVERAPIVGNGKRWFGEEMVITLDEEMVLGATRVIPQMIIRVSYNEGGDGRIARDDSLLGYGGKNESANFERYFPTREIVKMNAVGIV